jgi:hypothetical protein
MRPQTALLHNLFHRDPWRHKRCRACTFARRLWAAEDLLKRRGWPVCPARHDAAANMAEIGPGVLDLDGWASRRPR